MLLINCSNREENCFNILKNIKKEQDKIITLSNKKINFCLGCNKCKERLDKYCVLDDYITNHVYESINKEKNIIIASPIYMSNINAILKNLIDRLYPFYHHNLLKDKTIYLILTGQTKEEDNKEEINNIINYFEGISEWLYFKFKFLAYFEDNNINDYNKKIEQIKQIINK